MVQAIKSLIISALMLVSFTVTAQQNSKTVWLDSDSDPATGNNFPNTLVINKGDSTIWILTSKWSSGTFASHAGKDSIGGIQDWLSVLNKGAVAVVEKNTKIQSNPVGGAADEYEIAIITGKSPSSEDIYPGATLSPYPGGGRIQAYDGFTDAFGEIFIAPDKGTWQHFDDGTGGTDEISITVNTGTSPGTANVIIKDEAATTGMAYAADYSTNFGARSIVDKAYIDGEIAAIPSAPVTSVHGRTGVVVSVSGDYEASEVTNAFDKTADDSDDITEGVTNLFNQTHTGDVTGSTSLTISAKAVDVAMLADGTDGELITWDASGVATTVSTGTATHVLTSNGPGTAPTFQAAAGGDFADGGEAGGADRTIGNTDSYDFTVITNNLPRLSVYDDGTVGVGNVVTGPGFPFNVVDNNANANPLLLLNNTGTGDASIRFSALGASNFDVGIDNSASDHFIIGEGLTDPRIDIDPSTNTIGLVGGTPHATIGVTIGDDLEVSGVVGIGTGGTLETSAALEIESSTGALIVSRMTTTERNALTGVDGMVLYNETTNKTTVRENGAWIELGDLLGKGTTSSRNSESPVTDDLWFNTDRDVLERWTTDDLWVSHHLVVVRNQTGGTVAIGETVEMDGTDDGSGHPDIVYSSISSPEVLGVVADGDGTYGNGDLLVIAVSGKYPVWSTYATTINQYVRPLSGGDSDSLNAINTGAFARCLESKSGSNLTECILIGTEIK